MITEDYVSFETAKLLKEKGFDEECGCFYNNIDYGTPGLEVDGQLYYKNSTLCDEEYAAPTLQMVMKWLREMYKLYCDIKTGDGDFVIDIISLKDGEFGCEVAEPESCVYSTYEEACEAAIKYCFENLI